MEPILIIFDGFFGYYNVHEFLMIFHGFGPESIKISNIFFAVNEEIKTLNCKKDSKRGCNNKSVKCITHDLWDDLENHINDFFDKIKLADLTRKKNEK